MLYCFVRLLFLNKWIPIIERTRKTWDLFLSYANEQTQKMPCYLHKTQGTRLLRLLKDKISLVSLSNVCKKTFWRHVFFHCMDTIVSINYTTQDKKFVIYINGYVLYLQHILVQTLNIPIALQILNFKIV